MFERLKHGAEAGTRDWNDAGSPFGSGSLYGSFAYIHQLKEAGMAISMTQHGDPYENAIAERVNGILKTDFRLNQVLRASPKRLGRWKKVSRSTIICALI